MLCRKNALSFSRLSIISRIRVRIVLQSSVGLFLPLSFRLVSFLPILAKILLAVRVVGLLYVYWTECNFLFRYRSKRESWHFAHDELSNAFILISLIDLPRSKLIPAISTKNDRKLTPPGLPPPPYDIPCRQEEG